METCGYLAGKDGRVTQCYPVRNDDQAEEHFTFNPEEQLSAAANAEQEGLDIIALYHSHPIGLAWPSAEDVRLAFDPSLLYVIISLIGKKEDVRAFRIRGGEIKEERIVVYTEE
jgi:proteasome lid subunit RPN8/RPN11